MVSISDRGVRVAMLVTQLDTETEVFKRLALERTKQLRQLKNTEERITSVLNTIQRLSTSLEKELL
jgi:2-C-methyl-D-erythritol 4-phosphate cytidylyltransferase